MKILFGLLACIGASMVVMGIPRDFELVTQILPAAASPYQSGQVIGELTVSIMILAMTIWFARMSMRKRPDPTTAPGYRAMPVTGPGQLPLTWAEERALAAISTERPDRVGLKLLYRLASWYLCAYGLYGVLRDGNTLRLGMLGGSKAVSQPLPETLGQLIGSLLLVGLAIVLARLGRPKTPARPGIAGR